MADSFDPYHKWLGIPPAEQPPNHYRLLGIGLFEADLDVIEQAADRQMAHVQTHKTGSYSALSQRLLNELSAAKLCLLSAKEKACYDAALRARLAPAPPKPAVPPPAPVNRESTKQPRAIATNSLPDFFASEQPLVRSGRRSKGTSKLPLVLLGAATVAAFAAIYFAFARSNSDDGGKVAVRPAGVAPAQRVTQPHLTISKRQSQPLPTLVADPPPGERDADALAQPAMPAEQPSAPVPEPDKAPLPAASANASSAPDPAGGATAARAPGAVDLLKRIDPARDAVSGEWRMENGALLTPSDAGARLRIAFDAPAAYDIVLEAERLEGKGTLGLGLLMGASQVLAAIDAFEGTITGLDMVDGRSCNDNETTHHGGVLHDGTPNKVECRVRPNHIQLAVNGETLIDWQGGAQRLTTSFPVPEPPGLSLVVWGAKYRITRLEAAPVEIPQIKFAGPIDLLPLIDVGRDAVSGSWRREEAGILSPERGGWLMVPHDVPPAYLLDVEVRRLSKADSLGIGLPINGSLTEAVFDGWWGGICGLHLLDNREANDEANETRRAGSVIREGETNSIQCLVDKYGVTVRCNDCEVYDFSGDSRRLSFGGGIGNARSDRLYLGGAGAEYQFSKLKLTPLSIGDRRLFDLGSATARLGVPDEKALREAEKEVRQSFRDRRTAAKDPAGKIALARSIVEKAGEASPAIRYAMFQEAIGLAASAGDYSEATDAILAVSREFVVSRLVLKRQALAQVNGAIKAPRRKMLLADDALRLFDEAVLADDYETAEEAGRLAAVIARAAKDRQRSEQIRIRVKELTEVRREFENLAESRERLRQAPDDAESHRALGEFDCVWKRDGSRGMAHFNLGADPELRELAQDELLKSRQPAEKLALAERWLALAETATGEPRISYRVRGVEWFDRAGPDGNSPKHEELRNQVDALRRDSSFADRSRRWLERARAAFVHEPPIDGGKRAEWFNAPAGFAIEQSWSLTLEFAGQKPQGEAVLFVIGDGRPGRDPILVSLNGNRLRARISDSRDSQKEFPIEAKLGEAPPGVWRRLRISYRESDRLLSLFVDGEEAAAGAAPFAPNIDRPMPMWICGDNPQSQRFTGKVRMIYLSND